MKTGLCVQILMLGMTAGNVAAADWQQGAVSRDGGKCYYKPASIVQNKGAVRVWEKTAGAQSDLQKGVSEVRRLTEFDCEGRRHKTVMQVDYPTDASKELTVSKDEGSWSPIVPDSPADALAKIVCSDRQAGIQEVAK